jgi:6,7-dimethyl-8-ribityllumazine synthase
MSSKDQNLSSKAEAKTFDASKMKIGIVVAEWNEDITFSLRDGAVETLKANGIVEGNLEITYVPGAFELPLGARIMLQSKSYDGIICLGCVIKGDTKHDEYICSATASGIMQLGLTSGKPVIFGVLTPNTHEQAQERAGGVHGNKGVEAATTVMDMITISKKLKSSKPGIGF